MLAITPMISMAPVWRFFKDLSPIEAAFMVNHGLGSRPATIEVTCKPGSTNFALTELTPANDWHWAVCSPNGRIRDEGREVTLAQAKNVAVDSQRLWFHRCNTTRPCACGTPRG